MYEGQGIDRDPRGRKTPADPRHLQYSGGRNEESGSSVSALRRARLQTQAREEEALPQLSITMSKMSLEPANKIFTPPLSAV